MSRLTTTLLILTIVVLLLPAETYAFGAGDIPDFSYLNDKAFRHGDIENILENLVKSVGRSGGGGLLGFAQQMISQAAGGAKFSKSDVKKVYFGNWLRDYSQAMDIAGLSKLTAETLVMIVSVLGFMAFGFATEEFQVTSDRLGVYLPVEHIDNPKGYAEKEGDARQFHPKLRPPVDPRELEFDERTGMKNYMASENRGWDTSTAHIRRTFQKCIEIGRQSGGDTGADLWEAYRLLGTGLHTMEDLLAHSNWCEIALRKMGHEEVFCHVGDNVLINTPHGEAPPLVTGTFGSADFLHSLMGEATDKLSQASVTDLSEKMSQAAQGDNKNVETLRAVLGKLPMGGGDEKMEQGESIHQQAKAYNFNPDDVAPPEVQHQLWELLKWRDGIYRDILAKIEMVPGLSDLIEELTNALNAYVYTVLAPYLTPILQQATGVLGEGSKAVIDSEDQYAVFDDPNASDPSHSLLSKDHFGLILNEPAGKVAQVVVEHSVNLIVRSWSDNANPDEVINAILEAFHHPYYNNGRSAIQNRMFETMEQWIGGLGPELAEQTIQALTKESVRNGKNKRLGSENEEVMESGYSTQSYGGRTSGGGRQQYSGRQEGSYGRDSSDNTYGSGEYASSQRHEGYGGSRRQDDTSESYQTSYGSRRSDDEYGNLPRQEDSYSSGHRSRHEDQSAYGSGRHQDYSQQDEYGSKRDNTNTYGSRREEHSGGYGSSRRNEYGEQNEGGYGSRRTYGGDSDGYGSGRRDQGSEGHGSRRSYGEDSSDTYGSSRREYGGQSDEGYGSRRTDNESGHSGGYGSRRSDNEYGRSGYGESGGYSGGLESSGHGPGYGPRRYEGAGGREGYEYSSGNTYSSSSGYQPSYTTQVSNEYSSETRTHSDSRAEGYGGNYGSRQEESSGYTPGYGRRDDDDTFGAERLNIDDNEGGYGRRSHRHHQNEYESNY